MRHIPILMAALLLALPAAAQEVNFSPAATEECIATQRLPGATADALCIGESAKACYGRSASPAQIATCLGLEAGYWQRRVDAAYERMMDLAEVADADFAERAAAADIPFQLTTDLEQMQAAWADWREIRCAVEAMMRRGTPHTSTAAAACTMRRMGEQALFLESAVKFMETR
jgi:uncharacterized protein YecT (DUF1311 family)